MKSFAILCVLLAAAGCGDAVKVSVTTGPSLQDAWLSSDKAGDNRVTSFQPTDTIHVKADLVGAEAGTKVSAKLIAVEVDHPEVDANTEIGEFFQKFDGTLNRINFDLTNDGPLPSGSYKVDLSIAGRPANSLPFTVPADDGASG